MGEQVQDNQSMPENMGVEEALDFLQSGDKSEDYDGVATDDERDEDPDTEEEEDESEDSEEEEPEEEDDSDEEESDESDEDEEDDDDEDILFTIEDGDEEIAVDKEEAKKGYLRQRDYTKKTQEVARERKEVEQEKVSLLETKAQYAQALGEAKAMASDQLKDFIGIDWQQLQKDDPYEYEEKVRAFEAAKLNYEALAQKESQESQTLTKEAMDYAQKVRQEEMGKLLEHLPQVADEKSTILQDIRQFGEEMYGFTEEELLNIYDHRMIRVLADAFEANGLKKKVSSGKKKVKQAVSKTTKRKSSAAKTTAKARDAKARKKALNKPGGISIDDALRLMNGD